MPKSTSHSGNGKPAKPTKPYPDFPLTANGNGQWSKKIRGRVYYFGVWANPDAALRKYVDQRDDLHAGRTPRAQGDGLTVRDMCNRFLTAKEHVRETGEITNKTFQDYHRVCKMLVTSFGRDRLVDDLASDDFEGLRREMTKTMGPVTVGGETDGRRGKSGLPAWSRKHRATSLARWLSRRAGPKRQGKPS